MPEPPMMPRTAFVMISPLSVETTVAGFCGESDVLTLRHSGAVRRIEPGISRFSDVQLHIRVRSNASPRNDRLKFSHRRRLLLGRTMPQLRSKYGFCD